MKHMCGGAEEKEEEEEEVQRKRVGDVMDGSRVVNGSR